MAVARDKHKVKFRMLGAEDRRKATQVALPIWKNLAAKSPDPRKAVDAVKVTLKYLGRLQ
jgi:hypothetical protein